jgi:hypothetical protein
MRARWIGGPEKDDLDEKVGRILKDLGNPEPPVSLDQVRELLRLHKQYYSTSDVGFVTEIVHKMHLSGKPVLLKAARLIDVIRESKLTALFVPDTKTILIDQSEPKPKHRWMEGHEIAHALADWHKNYLHGDDNNTLNQECHEILEAEANYGSGRLLFMGPRFAEEARSLPQSMKCVFELAKRYGNSYPSTLWRHVREAFPDVPCYGLILARPKGAATGGLQCKHVIESQKFEIEFEGFPTGATTPNNFEHFVMRSWGHVGSGVLTLVDKNGQNRRFVFEGWTNRHEVLVLGRPS